MSKILILFVVKSVLFTNLNCDRYDDRPKIKGSNGDLILQPAFGKKLYLRPNGPKSTVFVGDTDMTHLIISTKESPQERMVVEDLNHIPRIDSSRTMSRLRRIEDAAGELSLNDILYNITEHTNQVENQITSLRSHIVEIDMDKCSSHPCENGGTCLNMVLQYQCLCPPNWEGQDCEIDVNECRQFAGTELGCQNGATCINKPGTYECLCRIGWYGQHCIRKTKDCFGGDIEMCLHGICVPTTTGDGIKCICDQGWSINGTGAACDADVDECIGTQVARCSVNPRVECINMPGSYRCGACPPGYEGDGHVCTDIDECLVSNGGCSSSPPVSCYNTVGSRICGACPPGYLGDGVNCKWRGSCAIDHGGCHPSARCIESPVLAGPGAVCLCPTGMQGDGLGSGGCYVTVYGNSSLHCESNPCGPHGRCHPLPLAYTCFCEKQYVGAHCDTLLDYCLDNPCHNGGTCTADETETRGYRCECTAQHSGDVCQSPAKTCGGVLDAREGSVIYPVTNTTSYSHNERCAWVIHTIPERIINVTFSKFDIEFIQDCSSDFLQIHDGRSSASQLIGRFCGTKFPNGGNILSSQNSLYFWFRTDRTVAKNGFAFHWTSVQPICGGNVSVGSHGHITSPGWPGKYPPNRDCSWILSATPGKRIQLYFFQFEIESHPNCNSDYLAIYDGARNTNSLLNKYCSNIQPAPIESSGSQLLIHFHSNAFVSSRGFQISYAAVEGEPGCGGLFTTQQGKLSSSFDDGRYLKRFLCDYEIRTMSNTKIRITFKYFNLKHSFRCAYDYVKIYDGISPEAPLVGKFCGHTHPNIYLSSSNALKIQFEHSSSTPAAFEITYETVCLQNIIGDSGFITSLYYPENHPINVVCEYIIAVTTGKAITLSFQVFDDDTSEYDFGSSCAFDNIEVRDGYDENATLLMSMDRFCGINEHSIPSALTSTHNYMYIKFSPDYDNDISTVGFYANYTTIDVRCGGIYRAETGTINHPSDSSEYDSNYKCIWLLQAPSGSHIKLTWNRFVIEETFECSGDYVELTEIVDQDKDITLGKFCGTTVAPVISTFTNRLKITLVSNKSDNAVQTAGFSLSYTFLDLKTHCGGSYISSNGIIHSPGGPHSYEANRDCEWTISVPFGQQILLKIILFDLESGIRNICDLGDFLEIRNGGRQNSPLVGKYCGKNIPRRFMSLGNTLYLHFHSNSFLSGEGFSIEWDGTINGCGGTLTGSTGSIASPNYPHKYGNGAECFYKIVINSGSHIKISFTDLDLERSTNCKADYVKIYDGRDSSAPSLGQYCTLSANAQNIETTSNIAFIKFRSDVLGNSKGFYLNYYTICTQNVTGSYGVIESPNYPNNYPSNLDCLWVITVPKGNTINVTFTHFNVFKTFYGPWSPPHHLVSTVSSVISDDNNVGCLFDHVQWKDGYNGKFSNKICGSALPSRIATKTNVLQIKFVSTAQYTYSGFSFEWVKDGCGGHFVKSFGIISFSTNSLNTEDSLECEWSIEAPPGKAINISFTNVYMMHCTKDAIEIYDGRDENDPLITKICERGMSNFQSTSNFMLIKFLKQSDYRDISFISNYRTVVAKCGGSFGIQSGTLYSPNYPSNYDNNLDCLWYISVPVNHLVEFNIADFSLYSFYNETGDCGDYIKIYDTHDIYNTNQSHVICPWSRTKQIISMTNNVVVQFVSDNTGTAKGFKANFAATCGSRIIVKNDGILTNDKIFSQQNNRTCVWTITGAQIEQKISFTLTYISLPIDYNFAINRNCPTSYLRIHDGDDEQAPVIGEFCGHKVPPMIVSRGNSITVVLGNYAGLTEGQFSAHYTTLDTACGGTLSSEEGTLASPNYPNSYPSMVSCEWIINTSPGNQAYITFESLDIEYSENCNEDYLEIRENDGSGHLLGLYCGTKIPINTAVANRIYIKFHSDDKNSGHGFMLHYGLVHIIEIQGMNKGQITSPLYPYVYEGPTTYSWTIISTGSEQIILNIINLYIPARGVYCYDSLSIYDGFDDTSPLLEELCGLINSPAKVIKTTGNSVNIILRLYDTNTGSTFNLNWFQDGSMSSCGYIGTNTFISVGESVNLMLPTYSNKDSTNCEYVYQSEPGTHLKLSLTLVYVENQDNCLSDSISIYTSETGGLDWKPIRKEFCTFGDDILSNDYANYVKVIFISGMHLFEYSLLKGIISSVCGGLLTSSPNVISIGNNCWNGSTVDYTWKVKLKTTHIIQIQFSNFNVSSENKDCGTYVKIYNGESKESPLFGNGKFCGYSYENKHTTMTTSSNTFLVTYHSESKIYQTFEIRYKEVGVVCGSSFQLTSDHSWEIINSPNYPSVPQPYIECTWTFYGPPGEILRVEFIDRFDLERSSECDMEFIEIRDGSSENSRLKGQFCETKPGTIKSSSNVMFIKYSTQIPEPRNGFKANVSIDICGGTIHAINGELSSPGYPHMQNLPVGTVCEWKVVGFPGCVYKITPLDFDLPESQTECATKVEFEVFSLANRTTSIIKTYCNYETMPMLTTDIFANEFSLKFHVGRPAKHTELSASKGYRFKYEQSTIQYCMKIINQPEGFITTPGYPGETNLPFCVWIITATNPARRVRLEIIDAQFNTGAYIVKIYNFKFKSLIETISEKNWYPSQNVYESSGPTMTIYLSLTPPKTEHHFKAKYSTNDESYCGESLTGEFGELTSPNLNRSYYCIWNYKNMNTVDVLGNVYTTLYLDIKANTTYRKSKCNANSKLEIKANILNQLSFIKDICSTMEATYRIPSLNVNFHAVHDKQLPLLYFHIRWKKYNCGGIIELTEISIDILKLPANHTGPLDCAWIVTASSDSKIELKLQGAFEFECTSEFLTINNWLSHGSAVTGKYCKNNIPSHSIVTYFKSTYIQYHTEFFYSNSTLKLMGKITTSSCGGHLFSQNGDTFMSPNYPIRYNENQECTWEIITDIGRKISLQFIERFVLEDKPNCTSDAVIVYDWIDNDFTEIGKVCGRNRPSMFNSTLNKMKVIFRTDAVINLDGFKAQWKPYCGGNYKATSKEQFIYSPGYPNEYSELLDCNYHIVPSNFVDEMIVGFSYFDLEGIYPTCKSDNLTITGLFDFMYRTELYCGEKIPITVSTFRTLDISFKTDLYTQKKGFKIFYKMYMCGSAINQPTVISLRNISKYEYNENCTWYIEAPINKIVVLKIIYIDTKESYECSADYIAAYEGLLSEPDKRIALVCGLINSTTVIKSSGNTMLLQSVTHDLSSHKDFKFEVYFAYSKLDGCGGSVDLVSKSSYILKSPYINNRVTYESFLDCTWHIKANDDKIIMVAFKSLHIALCVTDNQTNALEYMNCKCDFIEIRDGINPISLIMGKYCGHNLPPSLVSSGNVMSIRLYTDREVVSSGFELELTVKDSECEKTHYYLNPSTQIITSPGYENGILPRGLHCTYDIHFKSLMAHITIVELDLPPVNSLTNECGNDKLIITHPHNLITNNETFSSNFFVNSMRSNLYYWTYPEVFTFCGSAKQIDIESYYCSDLKINLVSSAEPSIRNYKGFKIELKYATWCPRNYTEPQGRMRSLDYEDVSNERDCYTLITAPENYTISLYFFLINSMNSDAGYFLKFYDGNKLTSPLIRTVVDTYENYMSIFSSGRYLLLHNHKSDTDDNAQKITYDLNYVTTNKGRGCGGKLQNVIGIITSPLYDNRNTCEWELETPHGSKLMLHFNIFNLGTDCENNYVQLLDRNNNVYSTYCEEYPADYISSDNYVKIVYINNINSEENIWVAEFGASN